MAFAAGVIGLGQMGRGIARALERAGLLEAAWDVSPEARAGAAFSPRIGIVPPDALAASVDILLLVVPSSREIAALIDEGLLAEDRPRQILVDLTTSYPAQTLRLAERARLAGRHYLDCGMSGGATGADLGRLTLMVGGDAEPFARARPVLEAIAVKIFHLGPTGAGHTMKLIHNMVCHTNFFALSEGCRMAERAGLDLKSAIDVINAGNARSYISEARFPNHILSDTFDGRSRVANLAKDLGMAADMAAMLGSPSPYTSLTRLLLERAVAGGRAEDDFTTLYRGFADLADRVEVSASEPDR